MGYVLVTYKDGGGEVAKDVMEKEKVNKVMGWDFLARWGEEIKWKCFMCLGGAGPQRRGFLPTTWNFLLPTIDECMRNIKIHEVNQAQR